MLPSKTRTVRFNSIYHCGLIGFNLLGALVFASRKILGNSDRRNAHVFASLVFVAKGLQRSLIRVPTSESGLVSLYFAPFSHPGRFEGAMPRIPPCYANAFSCFKLQIKFARKEDCTASR